MHISFNNKLNTELGLVISFLPSIPTPAKRITSFEVPGRNGSLTYSDNSYADIRIDIEFNIIDFSNLMGKIRLIKGWLLGAITDNKLIFSDDSGVYYKVKNVTASDIERKLKISGEFTATFLCEPFTYKDVADIVLTAAGTVNNTGTIYSEPIVIVVGTGDITLTINGEDIDLTGIDSGIVIDSSMKNAYLGSTNLNNKMSGDFPILNVGNNSISWTGNVTSVTIEPNWRYL